jgi:hypothetical protein
MDAIEENDVKAIQRYAADWLADKTYNQPIRMDADTLSAEIGKMSFSEARTDWEKLKG